jgi:hypothetical protein
VDVRREDCDFVNVGVSLILMLVDSVTVPEAVSESVRADETLIEIDAVSVAVNEREYDSVRVIVVVFDKVEDNVLLRVSSSVVERETVLVTVWLMLFDTEAVVDKDVEAVSSIVSVCERLSDGAFVTLVE